MIDIPGYALSSRLYESRVSLVFRARRDRDGIPVVLKILKDTHPSARELERYRHEYDLLRSLDTDTVIRALDLLDYRNTRVLVLEDFGADSLKRLAKQRSFTLAEWLRIFIDVARGLSRLHARHILHKDVNPSNLVHNPTTGQTKIIDFGIADRVSPTNPQREAACLLEGTLAYLAPEQTGRLNRVVDFRSDLYAFGITLYELLSGRLPFQARHALEWVHAQIARLPEPLHQVDPAIPEVLSDIVDRLMAKTAEARYQSASGLEQDLRACLRCLDAQGTIAPFRLGRQDRSSVFYLPQTLYGRETEIERLLHGFDACTRGEGAPVWLLVSGYSGTGKTSLVKEIHKALARSQGHFIEGKFDQYQRAVPYAALRQALTGLVGLWLTESEPALNAHRTRLLAAIGDLGQVILELVPNLELIIGPQPPVPELSGLEAQNRFNLACRHFFAAAVGGGRPLVLFIDDLQWADLASLNLLETLLTDRALARLMLIGAYRDNEVGVSHPLIATLDRLRERGVTPTRIELDNLTLADVAALTAAALHTEVTAVASLARLIHRKTLGNAFFVTQCLKALHADGLIAHDPESNAWIWDLGAIERANLTDDVVDLMAAKILTLAPRTRRLLELAACIGNRFDRATLTLIGAGDESAVALGLREGVTEGLLVPEDEAVHRFAHDRIQQAAYSLIDPDARERTHLEIGRLLLQDRDRLLAEGRIFDIVNQLDAGRGLILDADERLELARLNRQAAEKAMAAAAHAAAVRYLVVAGEALPADAWSRHYDLSFAIFSELARCRCFAGETQDIEVLFDALLHQARTPLDQVAVHRIRMEHVHLQGDYAGAIAIQQQALALLGVDIPDAPEALRALLNEEIAAVSRHLGTREIESLVESPAMRSRRHQTIMDVLMSLWTSAYLDARQELVAWASCRMTNLSLLHGNNHLTSYAYMNYAFVCVALLEDYERGHRFGQVAIRLSDRYDDGLVRGKVYLLFAVFVNHWRAPLISSLDYSLKAFPLLVENGDWTYAGYCAEFMISDPMIAGRSCHTLLQEARHYLPFLRDNAPVVLTSFYRPACLNPLLHLMGLTADETSFDDEQFSEAAFLEAHRDDALALSYFYTVKLRALYWMGALDEALALVDKADFVAQVALAQAKVPEIYCFASLTILAGLERIPVERRDDLLARIGVYQERMARWADLSPSNFRHKYLLVEAERARVAGETWTALGLFEQAIAAARAGGYSNNAALAHERLARFLGEQGLERSAACHMGEARYLYATWGASAKVRQLERLHSSLLLGCIADLGSPKRDPNAATLLTTTASDTFEISGGTEALDLTSIVQASQSLAGEIRLDGLLNRMMEIVMENAGADRCVLILERDGRLVARAEAQTCWKAPLHLEDLELATLGDRLPLGLIHYCARTREQVVLAETRDWVILAGDDYLASNPPQSALGLPLRLHGRLIGLLYLENRLVRGAFTTRQRRILELLSAQMAISIQNAELYTRLEDLVAERTAELTQVNARLQTANAELRQLSTTDGLTQVANRRYLDEYLEREWGRHLRRGRPLAILMCDVDHFKRYNDTHGHLEGDRCLIGVARALTAAAGRKGDLVARYGGEEFAVILPDVDASGVRAVIDKIHANIARLELQHPSSPVSHLVTISVGAYHGTPREPEPTLGLSMADRSLYQAKEQGRDRAFVNEQSLTAWANP